MLALALAGTGASCGQAPLAADHASGRLEFVDVAREAGIDLVNRSGDARRWYILESNGNGAAWLDYDGDGDLDLFLANGAGVEYVDDGRRLELLHDATSKLYRNDGGMRFTDVTEAAGAGRSEWGQTVATGDVDNDGDPDLYLGCFGPDVFLRNDGGRFVDATAEAGLGNPGWAAGAAFADLDRDGALDLYVANYCEFDPEHPPLDGRRNVIDGVEIGWGPEEENGQGLNPGAPDVFYYGDGAGGFREATRAAGFELEKPLCSYAVVVSDVNADGWPDVLVANDLQPCNLFISQGGGSDARPRFVDEAAERGFALNGEGTATSAMGLAVVDIDRDGDFDVLRTNFDLEPNSLHLNDGAGRFTDRTEAFGLAAPSFDRLGWGANFFDADCDGDLDLLVANGHVMPQAEKLGMSPWLQRSQLYEAVVDDDGAVTYSDVTERAGAGLAVPRSARGLALADADDDGDVDALIVDLDHAPRLLENRSQRRGYWISVALEGAGPGAEGGGSNRDGFGALVKVSAGGVERLCEMRTTSGLYSSHDPRLHFGLGEVERVDAVEVHWPSGRVSRIEEPELNTVLTVTEPAGI